ncbi:MAG TPA: histidine phosphatase family protein [Anaerolineales bacterium]|nr:histidine phosphatase family protein [Anaerolineales bacterium]
MQVVIVRHAVAFDRDPTQWPDDRQRPLTEEGEMKMRRAARGLRSLVPKVDVLLSSPWKRAWQTAEVLHEEAGWPSPKSCEALEGDRNHRGVLTALREVSGAETVALVGHEPQSHRLASYLLTGDAARVLLEFKKGAAAALLIESPFRAGTARLLWFLPPRALRGL